MLKTIFQLYYQHIIRNIFIKIFRYNTHSLDDYIKDIIVKIKSIKSNYDFEQKEIIKGGHICRNQMNTNKK